MIKNILFSFSLFSCCIICFSQNPRQIIDSLRKELNKNPTQLQKTKIFGDLCWYYNSVSLDSALVYGNKSVKSAKQINDENLYAQSLSDLGAVHFLRGEIAKSSNFYLQSLEIRKKQNNPDRIASLNFKIGNNFYKGMDYKNAMNYYVKALNYYEKTNNYSVIANLESNIALIYYMQDNNKKALEYFQKSAKYFQDNKMYSPLSNSLVGIGNVFYDQKNINLAKKYFFDAKQLAEQSQNKIAAATAYNNLGNIFKDEKKYNIAIEYILKSLKIRNEEKYLADAASSKISLAICYNSLKDYKTAKKYLLESLSYNNKNGTNEKKQETYEQLIISNAGLKLTDSIIHYLDKYKSAINQRTSKNVMQISTDLETKYQTTKKEKQIQKQKVDIINKERKINKILIAGSVISALLLFIIYLVYKNQKLKNKQQKQEYELTSAISKIENQNKLQEQRLSISRDLHDNIGAQLTFIISSVETLKQAFNITDEKISSRLSSISDFTRDTITELRDTIWAMNLSEIDFSEIRSRILNFVEKAQKSNEHIHIHFERDPELDQLHFSSVDGMNIYRITQEAVNNAMKYSGAKNILLTARKIAEYIEITIKDDGKGFEMDKTEPGNGIRNMQKRAAEINASISVDSKTGNGTSIVLKIPKS